MGSMMEWRVWLVAAAFAFVGGGYIAAQSAKDADVTTTVSPASEKSLTVPQMAKAARASRAALLKDFAAVDQLINGARGEKDVIKLDCLNNAFLRMKGLVKITEEAAKELRNLAAKKSGDDERAEFQHQKAIVSQELAADVLQEALACAGGEELAFGEGAVESSGPNILDDPTKDKKNANGFRPTNPEDPGLGSPF